MDSFEENVDNEMSENENENENENEDEDLLEAEDLFEDDDKNEEELLPAEDEASGEVGGEKKKKNDSKLKESKRRIVRNPRLCLNFQRLKSEYGLPALTETFEKFKFRGKHHEFEDLSLILQNLQHWMCHTLYPGYDFETCLKILENLGKKRVVQTHMRKLRKEAKDNLCRPGENLLEDNDGQTASNENYFDSVIEEVTLSDT